MSPENLAVLLAARFEAAQAAEGHLLAEPKAGHLNFKTQPGTTCGHCSSSSVSPTAGGADIRSMSIDSRDSVSHLLHASTAECCGAEPEQQKHVEGMHKQPAPSYTAASGRQIGAELSNPAQCHGGTAVLEQPHYSPLAKASIEPSHTIKRGVHVDAGYGNAREGNASMETRHQPAEAAETRSSDNRGSDAGPGPGSRAEQTR